MKLNDIGRQAIQDFLLKHHLNGPSLINKPHILSNWYFMAEKELNSGVNYPVIEINSFYSISGNSISLLLYDEWADEEKDRIGINDEVRPELLRKRVRDWC